MRVVNVAAPHISSMSGSVAFASRMGDNLYKEIFAEFKDDKARVRKFDSILDKTFHIVDKRVKFDISNGAIGLTNKAYPKEFYYLKDLNSIKGSLGSYLIVLCPMTIRDKNNELVQLAKLKIAKAKGNAAKTGEISFFSKFADKISKVIKSVIRR